MSNMMYRTPAIRKRCRRMMRQASDLLRQIKFKNNIRKAFAPKVVPLYVARAGNGTLFVFARVLIRTWDVESPHERLVVRSSFKILQSDMKDPEQFYRYIYQKVLRGIRHELSEGMYAGNKPVYKASHSSTDRRNALWGFACE